MDHRAAASKLPVELVSFVLDSLSFPELLGASRVSTFWRAVAFRHPCFWRKIKLTSLATPALDLFEARLRSSSNQTISIHISLREVQFPARLRSVVMPAVARNLCRLDGLYIEANIAHDADVFEFLVRPAPRLITLDIYFPHETQSSHALPVDLFAGCAPNLRNLRLQNVQIPSQRIPSAFSSVIVLKYGTRGQQTFPTAVFERCTALQELSIWGKQCTLIEPQNRPCIQRARQLASLDVAIFSGSHLLLQKMPCASIPYTSLPLGDVASARMLLGHLSGRLEVSVSCSSTETLLQYTSPATKMTRAFIASPGQVGLGFLPSAYIATDVLARIDSISATADATNLLTAFAYLPSCTRATFTLTDDRELKAPSMPLYAQELQTICISSAGGARALTAADLDAFLDATFLPIPHAIQVVLEGVTVDGDIGAIPRDRFLVSHAAQALATGLAPGSESLSANTS